MRTSKSDTSLTDSFVKISEAKKKPINPLNSLRPEITVACTWVILEVEYFLGVFVTSREELPTIG
ncbi:uncharacterized protein isoform X2 [Leptinotarsa decemlineata]|uniref:uncharacterized protein isoform X2 n=1 Tax=Leptinotarsa decemlineata TaxID=7539 RepID=UPI003D30B870